MKFYDCETAGSPRRVRIFIAEKGLEIPTTMVDLRNGEQLGAEFRKLNPDCTVPVLELDDGTALSEVFAICQYLEALHPEPCLMGSDDKERAQVKKTARELLATLKHEKLVLDWRKRQQARAEVRVTIETLLDEGLPRAYTPELYQAKSDLVYQHVFDSYFGAGRSIYEAAA